MASTRGLGPILFQDHDQLAADAERTSPVAAAMLSPAALRKRGRRSTDEGVPLCSFRDLMAHLATQTMNVVAVPGAPEAAFTTTSKATALQEAAFKLLNAEPLRVQ